MYQVEVYILLTKGQLPAQPSPRSGWPAAIVCELLYGGEDWWPCLPTPASRAAVSDYQLSDRR